MISYYSKREINEQIANSAKNKEVGIQYSNKGFGKRPDVLQFGNDIQELAKQGATSFHISEETWSNPLELQTGMTKRQLDQLRIGWDLVIDIDSPDINHSKIIAKFVIEALKFHDVKSIFCKFSGNKGFHIIIPFEAFPNKINNIETRLLFPEGPKAMMMYLSEMIHKHTLEAMPDKEDQKIELDVILISSRHMYRAPYSLHEKSGLASIPVDIDKIMEFEKSHADPSKVIAKPFINRDIEVPDAEDLIIQAFDWQSKKDKMKELKEELFDEPSTSKNYEQLTEKIPEKFFPPSIQKGLEGMKDGKKRFLFILINFLRCVGWPLEDISKRIKEWNKLNEDPLKEGYIMSQISWNKRQKDNILPPNYSSNYYKDLRIEDPEPIVRKFKNPVNYAIMRFKMSKK